MDRILQRGGATVESPVRRLLLSVSVLTLAALASAGVVRVGLAAWVTPVLSDDRPLSESVASVEAPPAAALHVRSRADYLDGILARNVFDHSALGQQAPTPGATPRSTLQARLVATVVADDATLSSALIEVQGSSRGYAHGERIQGRRIVSIQPGRVVLRLEDGSDEVLIAGQVPPRGTGTAAVARPTDDGYTAVADNRWQVERTLLDSYLADPSKAAGLGQARPHQGDDGQVDGYRLSRIRRGELAEGLGLRNGDVVHAVNGQPLTSVSGAMAALQALQDASSFTFEITRRGSPLRLEYEVR